MALTDLFYRRSEPRWMMNQEPPPYGHGGATTPRTELHVIMCCNKCEEKVREEIADVYGVQDILTDQVRSEVVVFGFADSHDVLKKARKIDKHANILSTDSFTLHYSKHGHRHNKIHYKHGRHHRSDYAHGHVHGIRSGIHSGIAHPIETVGSPRYNSNFHQSGHQSNSYGSRYLSRYNNNNNNTCSYDVSSRDYRHQQSGYRPELESHRHLHDAYGYGTEPDLHWPRYLETRSVYDEYRPEHDHRYRYNGYRPSQSYPPRYVDEPDYGDSPYPMNPDYLKQMDYY